MTSEQPRHARWRYKDSQPKVLDTHRVCKSEVKDAADVIV
jgi:hypothetical protein